MEYLCGGPQGPAGSIGPKGETGSNAMYPNQLVQSVQPSGYNPLPSVFMPGAIIQPNPATNYSGGSLFSATDLSSSNFTTNIAKVTTLNVTTLNVTTLNVTGNSGLTGNLDIVGSFSQTGANTFSTGTGAISLNGATTITGANTFPLVLEL